MKIGQFKEKYGTWAAVAGAAEGLGEAYARALARRGTNVLMVDNQGEKMNSLARELRQSHPVVVQCLELDLAHPGAPAAIMETLAGLDCRLLLYNAAFSRVKPFLRATPGELDTYVDVNCRTPLRLVWAFAGDLEKRGQTGGILLMSSLAGLIGMQLVAPYGATKAFTWNLAEALHHDLEGTGIDVMACLAGSTATPGYLGTQPQYGTIRPLVMDPDEVAERALGKLGRRTLYIPGLGNRVSYFILTRLLPRRMAAALANRTMGTMYARQKAGG